MQNNSTTYVIFGASGDLAKRYLIPALENIKNLDKIVHISRRDYPNLKNLIEVHSNKIFHLAIPPQGVVEAVETIHRNFGSDNIKIMLEKPFGQDLESAQSLVKHIDQYFKEEQIYRVDHYLAKKSLQNIVSEEWDRNNIGSIEIIASEKVDVATRANFYEQTGALKDFVQSHLLEMAAVVLAGSFDAEKRQRALSDLGIVCDVTKNECVKRGQYRGYREEVGNSASMTETFVSINLASSDTAWRGTRIVLSTGKALSEKLTQIKITYKNGVEKIFNIEHEPDAYERVINSAINGNRDLFISSGEVLETWRILQAIQDTWKSSLGDLIIYPKGTEIANI